MVRKSSNPTAVRNKQRARNLLNSINTLKKNFRGGAWRVERKVSSSFIPICVELELIKEVGMERRAVIYETCVGLADVTDETGEKIRIALLAAATKRKKKQATPTPTPTIINADEQHENLRKTIREFIEKKFEEVGHTVVPTKVQDLSEYNTDALLVELNNRGFSGTISRSIDLGGVSKLEEIELNKK